MNSKNNDCGCNKEEDCNCGDKCECEDNEMESPQALSLDNLDEDTKRKIQELQMLEQGLQQFAMQKQAFSMELDETGLCLEELKKASGEIFKIVGGKLVIKTDRDSMQKELSHKQELIELRLKTMAKQEEDFLGKIELLRQEIIKKISGN